MRVADTIPELDAKGLRDFAFLTGGFVACLFGLLLPWLLDRAWPAWPWIVGGVLAAWGFAAPLSVRPLYTGWMRVGLLIGRVMTPLFMAALFFLVVTPVGMIRRLLAGDPMPKYRDGSAETYRVKSSKRNPRDLKRPF